MRFSFVLVLRLFVLLSVISQITAGLAGAEGNRWASIGPNIGSILTLAIDPSRSNTIYVGTFYGGIFKTTDGGRNWSAANGPTDTNRAGLPTASFSMVFSLWYKRTSCEKW